MAKNRPGDCGAGEKIGRYSVVERLGKGAMGEVYLAHDEGLVRDVAVKILAEAHRHNTELRARFVREARAVARVTHPNVVQIFLIDEHGDLPYFAMEYLKGRDLGGLLADFGPLEQGQALAVVRRAAAGLQAAANAGVVHRDVKPANILVTESAEVKLTDFGLAKTIHVDPELTAAGLVVGTPDYIAPEQAQGDPADSRSDIYSLGCTLYHLINGKPPFRTPEGPNTYMAILSRHMHQERPDLRYTTKGTDPDVAALCRRMMAIRASERPDFENLLYELTSMENRLNGAVPMVSGSPKTDAHPTVTERPVDEKPLKKDRSDRSDRSAKSHTLVARTGLPGWALVVTALCAAVFLTGLGLRISEGSRGSSSDSGPAPAVPPGPDPAVAVDAGTDEDPVGSGIPWTTVFVPGGGSRSALYVAVRPVSILQWETYTSAGAGGSRPRPTRSDDPKSLLPVTGVSFKRAAGFAKHHGARLPHADEWDRIRRTRGILFPDPALWEWVSGRVGRKRALTVRVDGATRIRRANRKRANVTFRIVWEAVKTPAKKGSSKRRTASRR